MLAPRVESAAMLGPPLELRFVSPDSVSPDSACSGRRCAPPLMLGVRPTRKAVGGIEWHIVD